MTEVFWIAIAVWFMLMSTTLVVLWATCVVSGRIAESNEDTKEKPME